MVILTSLIVRELVRLYLHTSSYGRDPGEMRSLSARVTPLGPPKGPRHRPTVPVGSQGLALSYERGTCTPVSRVLLHMHGIKRSAQKVHNSFTSIFSLNILFLITNIPSNRTLQPHPLRFSACLLQKHGEGQAASRQFVSVSSCDQGTLMDPPFWVVAVSWVGKRWCRSQMFS